MSRSKTLYNTLAATMLSNPDLLSNLLIVDNSRYSIVYRALIESDEIGISNINDRVIKEVTDKLTLKQLEDKELILKTYKASLDVIKEKLVKAEEKRLRKGLLPVDIIKLFKDIDSHLYNILNEDDVNIEEFNVRSVKLNFPLILDSITDKCFIFITRAGKNKFALGKSILTKTKYYKG